MMFCMIETFSAPPDRSFHRTTMNTKKLFGQSNYSVNEISLCFTGNATLLHIVMFHFAQHLAVITRHFFEGSGTPFSMTELFVVEYKELTVSSLCVLCAFVVKKKELPCFPLMS